MDSVTTWMLRGLYAKQEKSRLSQISDRIVSYYSPKGSHKNDGYRIRFHFYQLCTLKNAGII